MEEYDVNVRVELFDIVKAHNEDEAIEIVEKKPSPPPLPSQPLMSSGSGIQI